MAISFHVIETTQSPLWDYGWFDLTRIRIEDPVSTHRTHADVIQLFAKDPIYQRSFCESPDPWGVAIGRHGPFYFDKVSPEWYQRVTAKQLRGRVSSVISDGDFDLPPRPEQMSVIDAWIENVDVRRDALFAMDAPDDDRLRVDWADAVWMVFREFLSVTGDASELSVAVIGYD